MWALKLLQNRRARSTTKHIAASLALAPTSQTDSGANSQGFSAAATELTDALEFVFAHGDLSRDDEAEHGDLLKLHLERLAKQASRYENSRVSDENAAPWTCTPELSQLLVAACQCACYVYKPDTQPNPELIPVLQRTPSITGTIKATALWKHEPTKTLVVSIRGTASPADHMVNMNRDSQDASAVFKFSEQSTSTSVSAHRGFLACATALLPWLIQEIVSQVELDVNLKHIVFTGHSAGGAVASLVFLHFVCQTPVQVSSLDLSLLTFGPPPATSINVTALAKQQPRVKHVLTFVNEFDIVPRLDRAYMLCLVDLYRSAYGLPPATADKSARIPQPTDASKRWEFPPPDHHIIGDIVILRSRIEYGTPSQELQGDTLITHSQRLDAVQVAPRDFEQLLFCDLSAHKRRLYLERIQKLV